MTSPQYASQYETQAIPTVTPQAIYPPAGPPAGSPAGSPVQAGIDPASYWYGQYRKQRRRSRFLMVAGALVTVVAVGLGFATFALAQQALTSPLAALVPGQSNSQPVAPDAGAPQPGAAQPEAGNQAADAADLARLQELLAKVKNPDGSVNMAAIAGLASELGTLAQEPEKLNSLLDQAQDQGMIDPSVASLLRGLLAQQQG